MKIPSRSAYSTQGMSSGIARAAPARASGTAGQRRPRPTSAQSSTAAAGTTRAAGAKAPVQPVASANPASRPALRAHEPGQGAKAPTAAHGTAPRAITVAQEPPLAIADAAGPPMSTAPAR